MYVADDEHLYQILLITVNCWKNCSVVLGIIDWVGESIQHSESNQISVKFDLSDHLQSRCQQCMPAGNNTGPNHAVL